MFVLIIWDGSRMYNLAKITEFQWTVNNTKPNRSRNTFQVHNKFRILELHARKENNMSHRFTSCQVVQCRFTTYGLPISWSDLHCGVIVHVVKHLLIRVGFCSLFSAAILSNTECKGHTFRIIMYHSSLFLSFLHSGIIFFRPFLAMKLWF